MISSFLNITRIFKRRNMKIWILLVFALAIHDLKVGFCSKMTMLLQNVLSFYEYYLNKFIF